MEVNKIQNFKVLLAQPRARLIRPWCVVGRTRKIRKRRVRRFWPCCSLASRIRIPEYGMPSSIRSGRWLWRSRSVWLVWHRAALGTGLIQRSRLQEEDFPESSADASLRALSLGFSYPEPRVQCQSALSLVNLTEVTSSSVNPAHVQTLVPRSVCRSVNLNTHRVADRGCLIGWSL